MTHKKIILMALMGVMLSDAEAAKQRVQPGNASKAQSRGRGARVKPQMKAGNSEGQNALSDLLAGEDTGAGNVNTEQEAPVQAPQKNEQVAPEANVEELLDLNVMEKLTQETKTLLKTDKTSMTRGEVLEKVTGKKRGGMGDDALRAQGNLLDTWAAIGGDDQKMGDYLMTKEMAHMLNAFSKASRVGGTAKFGGSSSNLTAEWDLGESNKVKLMDDLPVSKNFVNFEGKLIEKFDAFFDALEGVKFATVDGLVDFPEFSRANLVLRASLLNAVDNSDSLHEASSKSTEYAKIMNPVLKAWQETATNAIKAIQKLAADEKAKGKTLFLPELVQANGAALAEARAGGVKSTWEADSTTAGIKGVATTSDKDFMFKLVSVKPGEKSAFLKMNALVAPTGDISSTDLTAKDVVKTEGVKLLKKLSGFYKKAKGKRAPFNPAAWQQKVSSFTVEEQKIIDAYNAELAKKASGTDFTKAKTKLEGVLKRKTEDGLLLAALGGKFARGVAQEDSEDSEGI